VPGEHRMAPQFFRMFRLYVIWSAVPSGNVRAFDIRDASPLAHARELRDGARLVVEPVTSCRGVDGPAFCQQAGIRSRQ
jgi:hypothetical protein